MTTETQRRIKEERKLHAIHTLDKLGIKYQSKNQDLHFIIQCDSEVEIHFWPTTDKAWFPKLQQKGKGLNKVLEWVKQEEQSS